MAKSKYYQGIFKPKNKDKYAGDSSNIIYRSSWELRMLNYLDCHPDVIYYASEEFSIPYISPVDGRVHRYFPDFLVKKKAKDGMTETLVVEIKPHCQTKPPKQIDSKRLLNEAKQYAINQAKWKAAEQFCADRKWKFVVITENELGLAK